MAQPAVRVLKILLDWPEKASVLVVASLAVSACCEGFSILRVFQKLGILAYRMRLGEWAGSRLRGRVHPSGVFQSKVVVHGLAVRS